MGNEICFVLMSWNKKVVAGIIYISLPHIALPVLQCDVRIVISVLKHTLQLLIEIMKSMSSELNRLAFRFSGQFRC